MLYLPKYNIALLLLLSWEIKRYVTLIELLKEWLLTAPVMVKNGLGDQPQL